MALSHVAALLTKMIIFVVFINVFFRLLFADAAGNQRTFKVSSFVGKLLLCAAKHMYNQQNVICARLFPCCAVDKGNQGDLKDFITQDMCSVFFLYVFVAIRVS